MSELQGCAPLAALGKASYSVPGFDIQELPCMTKLRLQSLCARGTVTAAATASDLPAAPNSVVGDDPWIFWKAPGDWLACSTRHTAAELTAQLSRGGDAAPLVTTDVSAAYTVLEIGGPELLEILSRDCTLDLEGGAIAPGGCAQTVIAQVPVLLHRLATGARWRLFVDRSLADYLRDWLIDSAGPSP